MSQTPAKRAAHSPGLMVSALLVVLSLLTACATSSTQDARPPAASARTAPADSTPVIRYGRYTLVELVPSIAQQDLMQQVIDVTLPAAMSATVGDALRYVLLRTGYLLCEGRDEVRDLESLPLPAAHLHLGPLPLRQALQLLAGSGWLLQVDDGARHVCFTRRTDPAVTSVAPMGVAAPRDESLAREPPETVSPAERRR